MVVELKPLFVCWAVRDLIFCISFDHTCWVYVNGKRNFKNTRTLFVEVYMNAGLRYFLVTWNYL